MKIIKYIVIALIAIALIAVGSAFLLPQKHTVQASLTINTPSAVVFPFINTPAEWEKWMPTIGRSKTQGRPNGLGARLVWTDRNGTTLFTIIKSVPEKRVKISITNKSGIRGTSEIMLRESDGSTRITATDEWNFGNNPLHRWVGFLTTSHAEDAVKNTLASLKKIAEAEPTQTE